MWGRGENKTIVSKHGMQREENDGNETRFSFIKGRRISYFFPSRFWKNRETYNAIPEFDTAASMSPRITNTDTMCFHFTREENRLRGLARVMIYPSGSSIKTQLLV